MATATSSGGRKLVWHEDFRGPEINQSNWYHEVSAFGGGNEEFQVYTPDRENSYIQDSTLHIKPTLLVDKFGEGFLKNGVLDVKKIWGVCTRPDFHGDRREARYGPLPPVLSAKLISKFAFKYGRLEVDAKMPLGDWLWPAIWLLPRDNVYGGWLQSGEIDIAESRGNRNYGNLGAQKILSTLHYGTMVNGQRQNGCSKSSGEKMAPEGRPFTWAEDFHTYFLDWTADHIHLGVDDHIIMEQPTPPDGYWKYGGFTLGTNPWQNGGRDAPFDQKMVIQLNVAVGGTRGYFPENHPAQPRPWKHDHYAARDFWQARDKWYPTWQGDTCALRVKDIRVFQ